MSREQLMAMLQRLLVERDQERDAQACHDRIVHDLQVHQIELEMQNRELRDARNALEDSRNRYADLYDFAPVAYCTISESGVIEELNLTAATLFGIRREDAQGRPFCDFALFGDTKSLWQHLGECAAKQGPVISELLLHIRGRAVDVEAVSVPIVALGSRRAHAFRTAFSDISRRKQAERELAEALQSEQLLRARLQALDDAQVAIGDSLAAHEGGAIDAMVRVITEKAREVGHADLASLDLGGRTGHGPTPNASAQPDAPLPHELSFPLRFGPHQLGDLRVLRAPLEAPFSDHDRETLRMFAERAASGLQVASLQALETRENARLSLLDRVGSELNRAHDREGAEEAIARILEASLEAFADSTALYLDEGGSLVLAHCGRRDAAQAERAHATLNEPRVSESVASWLRSSLQDGRAHLFDFSSLSEQLAPPLAALARAIHASSMIVAPLIVRDQTLGVVCFGRATRALAFARFELSWVEELSLRCALALDNARLFEELRAALDWRETLLATISHDLKSPLSAIRLSASSLVPETPLVERRTSGRQIELIRRSADYMNNMVNDLLLENLLQAGTFEPETRVEDARLLLNEACELCESLAVARGASLESELSPAISALRIDKERVLRVFSNLISNAAKFSQRGATIRVAGEPRDGMALFSVQDHGPGIAPELRETLFDRYARGKNSPHGLGLGLYIAKSIVNAHGGQIWVESAPEQGSTFFFTLPIARS